MTTMPNLDSLRWTNRVILVFTAGNPPQLIEQNAILEANHDGLADRDVKVFRVVVDGIGAKPGVEKLREKFGVGNRPFAFVLIGKDGSVKLRKYTVVSADEVFQTIDAMPMRKEEMRRK